MPLEHRIHLFLKRFVGLDSRVIYKTFSTQIQRRVHFDRATSPSEHYLNFLRVKFGLTDFKPLQWTVIQSLIENKQDNYVCLPTGYGKSLCYQYPAVYCNGLSIIISPLISLMQNQVKYLENIDVPSCFISCIQENRGEIVEKLLSGHYRLFYITPESALSSYGLKLFQKLYREVKITLIAIDEAQCILHWGQDFRPFYKELHQLRSIMPQIPILALTASTTYKEKEMIVKELCLRDVQYIHEGLNRKNLYFIVKKSGREVFGDISTVLTADASKYNIVDGSVIVYCLTKKSTMKIANLLNLMGINCQAYHSGLNAQERMEVLENFMSNKIKIIVATTAFGLGVHKSNIRFVIHYGTSLNMENYYQEVGRAGRDGERALCVLFYSFSDFSTHRYLGKDKKSHDWVEHDTKLVMKKYIMNSTCRRKFILSHFDESYKNEKEFEIDCCDICTNNLNNIKCVEIDCTLEVEIFLQTIKSLQPKSFGIKFIVQFILGSKKKNVLNMSLNNKYFGIGGNKSENWWNRLALLLEIEKYIEISSKLVGTILYSKVSLNEKGELWLRKKNNGLILPVLFKLGDEII